MSNKMLATGKEECGAGYVRFFRVCCALSVQ